MTSAALRGLAVALAVAAAVAGIVAVFGVMLDRLQEPIDRPAPKAKAAPIKG